MITFKIEAGTYDYNIYFCITEDKAKACKFVSLIQNYSSLECDFEFAKGVCFRKKGYCPVIWIPKVPKEPVQLATLSHEIFHAVVDCFIKWTNIPLTYDSEEAYCHLIGKITREFWNNIKKYKNGKRNRR